MLPYGAACFTTSLPLFSCDQLQRMVAMHLLSFDGRLCIKHSCWQGQAYAWCLQDHKAVGEGDTGPNTGGMGAYSPAPAVTPQIQEQVMQEIVQRTADALVAEGCPYRGVLFAGLMIKGGKVRHSRTCVKPPIQGAHPGLMLQQST